MVFSSKSRYAIIVLMDLGLWGRKDFRTIKEISTQWKISSRYISRLVLPLRKKGFIESRLGPNGGHRLAMNPKDIRILDVIDTMDSPFNISNCMINPKSCARFKECKSYSVWQQVNNDVREVFAKLTLKKLIANYPEYEL